MSGLVNALVILAVIGLVIARQTRPRRLAGGRWWLIPAALIVLAIRQGGLLDPHHRGAALALLIAELIVGAVMGTVWATTTRMWTDEDGSVWSQGTRATIAVWAAGIAIRVGLYGTARALGVRQDSGSVLIAVAVTLLIRAGVLVRRAQALKPAPTYRTVS
ncbi:CcdC protein domain-containing protein [Actinacidiphila acididurans]|uniref:DUF1453 family protein n=1 Tax=Actinacidiphila acididurans TaxID=2784346 RepID=A0ABS2TV55_9ACTN|nr:CcdC protein domain-containing protein [Actinacidiphila acididurans]MBM9507216.1 DUF1453 family protein [Actinacidiphila acididurans]